MKKLAAPLFFVVIFCLILSLSANIGNSAEPPWLASNWFTKGSGWAEKGIVRASGDDKGRLLFGISSAPGGDLHVVSLDIKAELNISKFNINAWDFSESTVLPAPIPIPDAEPTASNPFKISVPPFETKVLKVTKYEISIESSKRGKMKLHGELKEHGVEFDLENVLWQAGTPEPDDPDNKSGCNSVFGAPALLLFAVFIGKGIKSVNCEERRFK